MKTPGVATDKWTILKASIKVFQKKGYRDTTMKDLAEESGVDLDEVRAYFPTKATYSPKFPNILSIRSVRVH